ncbi:MAG: hypothetical protein IKK65_03205 [Clostridia bacterium]|nr:hypothetical protein [Clostridia bacterium]
MLQFILGTVVGGIVGFAVCAICSMVGTDDRTDTQCTKKTGEENARSK